MFQDRSARAKQTSYSDFAYPNHISISQICRYQRVSPRHFTEPNRTLARARVAVPAATRFGSVSCPKNALEKHGLHGYHDQSTYPRPPLQMMLDQPFRGGGVFRFFTSPTREFPWENADCSKPESLFGNYVPQTFP